MTAQVVIHIGPARSGKTHALVRHYRDALDRARSQGEVDRTLWLAPTARSAANVREQLLDAGLTGCLTPGILTFDQLTTTILAGEDALAAQILTLTSANQRALVRRTIAWALEGDKLSHFRLAAARPGFVDLLVDHIRELKRHGITPDVFSQQRSLADRAAEHRELAVLYTEYERRLAAHRLRDAEDRHTAARDLLATSRCARFGRLDLVVVDGFTDFTRSQHEILAQLAARANELRISLPGDAASPRSLEERPGKGEPPATDAARRPDLFAKSSTTLAELQHIYPTLKVERVVARPFPLAGIDFLATHLFGNPRELPPLPADAADSLRDIEIVEAAGEHDEIVQIARRIKARLANSPLPCREELGEGSCRPGDIVVVFRTLTDTAPRVREVFAAYGIPYSIEAGLPLSSVPVVKTLLQLLRLDREDWPFRRVIAALTNNSLSALDSSGRRAAEWLVRDLQIARGRDGLLQRAERLAATDAREETLSTHAAERVRNARIALPALRQLAAAFDALPDTATATEWTAALAQLLAKLGLKSLAGTDDGDRFAADESSAQINRLAWNRLGTCFAAAEQLAATLDESRELTRSQMVEAIVDFVRHERLPLIQSDVGRVRVLAAQTARGVAARHLFLAGMSEQAFPSPERAGRLATTDDYRRAAALPRTPQSKAAAPASQSRSVPPAPPEPPPTRSQEEMLLFYEVLTRAEESLTISYPALDDKAQPLPPSPYVTEILRALDPDNKRLIRRTPPQLSPVAAGAVAPLDAAEWRLHAVARAIGTEHHLDLLAGLLRADSSASTRHAKASATDLTNSAAALEAGLRIIHARKNRDAFGPAEGLLTSPAVAARLAERFGPEHCWSPSQWENYAACPYRFFLADVMKLEPLGDLVLETDYLRRGSLLHQVLAAFHRNYGAAAPEAWAKLQRDPVQFVAELKATLQAAVDAAPRDGIDAALAELDRRQIEKWAGPYGTAHGKYDEAWATFDTPPLPTHFEFRFGPSRPGDAGPEDAASTNNTFALQINGETIYIAGRIDRIDVGKVGGQTVFNVIDYKSGRRPPLSTEKIASGERLQPALYAMAAEALIFGPGSATPLWAGYWSMQNGVATEARYSLRMSENGTTASDAWQELRPKIEARIAQFVSAIRRGEFPVASRDADCTSRCDFRTVCRVAQVRSLGKIWEPS